MSPLPDLATYQSCELSPLDPRCPDCGTWDCDCLQDYLADLEHDRAREAGL